AMLDLDDQVGALKPGLDADVVLWSGDPLDVMNRAMRVFVRGREVYHFDSDAGIGVTAERRYRES
ncbi:MAG TPA: amidohydrolase, partial [Amycolatopsis sp.]|nr:amidohydrolase [Amycolatopsis sp.]